MTAHFFQPWPWPTKSLWRAEKTQTHTVVPRFPDIRILKHQKACLDNRMTWYPGNTIWNFFVRILNRTCMYPVMLQLLVTRYPDFQYDSIFGQPASISGHSISGFLLSGNWGTSVLIFSERLGEHVRLCTYFVCLFKCLFHVQPSVFCAVYSRSDISWVH